MLEVKNLNAPQFFKMEHEWSQLLKKSKVNCFFLSWEWLSHFWDHFGNGRELLLLGLYKNNRLCGIAPLVKERVYFFKHIPITRIGFIGADILDSDYLDFIFDSQVEKECMEAVLKYLQSPELKWDLMDLKGILSKSLTFEFFKNFATKDTRIVINKGEICPYLKLPGSVDDYIRSLSKNTRYNIKRRTKNLFKHPSMGKVELIEENLEIGVEKLTNRLAQLFDLHRRRWAEMGMRTMFGSEKVEKFHRTLLAKLANKERIVFYSLRVGKKIVAIIYGFKDNNKFLFYQSGYDPAFAKNSPGLVLMNFSIEKAIKNGMSEYDFLRGEEKYKAKFTKTFRQNYNITVWNKIGKKKRYLENWALCYQGIKRIRKIF